MSIHVDQCGFKSIIQKQRMTQPPKEKGNQENFKFKAKKETQLYGNCIWETQKELWTPKCPGPAQAPAIVAIYGVNQ